LSISRIDARYRATFGRTHSSLGDTSLVLANIAFTVGLLIDLVGYKFAQWPSAAAIALGLSSFVIVVRDWRWRLHHVIPLAAAIVAALMTASVALNAPAFKWEGDSVRGSVFLFAYGLIGAGMMVAGLLDHALLVQTLRPGVADVQVPSVDRVRAGRSEARLAAVVGGCALLTLFFPAPQMVVVLPFSLSMAGTAFWMLALRKERRHESWPHGWPARPLDESRDFVVPTIVLSIAAITDVALSSAGPVVSTAVFGMWSYSIAARNWRTNRHYLLGAFTAVALLLAMPHLGPARALTVCVLLTSGAVAIERYMDSEIEMNYADDAV
jgi:hypothetical protein